MPKIKQEPRQAVIPRARPYPDPQTSADSQPHASTSRLAPSQDVSSDNESKPDVKSAYFDIRTHGGHILRSTTSHLTTTCTLRPSSPPISTTWLGRDSDEDTPLYGWSGSCDTYEVLNNRIRIKLTDASKENVPDRHPIGQQACLEMKKAVPAGESSLEGDEAEAGGSGAPEGDEEKCVDQTKGRVKGKKRKRDQTGKYYERIEKDDPSSVYWRKEIGKYLAVEVLGMAKPQVKALKNLEDEPVEPDWTLDDFPEDYVLYRLVDPDPPKGRTGNDKYLFGAVAGVLQPNYFDSPFEFVLHAAWLMRGAPLNPGGSRRCNCNHCGTRGQATISHDLKNKRRTILGMELLPPLQPKKTRGRGVKPLRTGMSRKKGEGSSGRAKGRDASIRVVAMGASGASS